MASESGSCWRRKKQASKCGSVLFSRLKILGGVAPLRENKPVFKLKKKAGIFMAKRRRTRIRVPPAEKAIQLKVTLCDTKPLIWRRITVPDNFTLGWLHSVIQVAMGWHDGHMHAFRIGDDEYTSEKACEMDDLGMKNEEVVLLDSVITQEKQVFSYEYDFGDGWEHEIVVEKFLPVDPLVKHPVCLAGKRACPPDDCGGVPGYEDILKALKAKKKTEDRQEMLAWLGDYDPAHFDKEEVNRILRSVE
jgi:hypothetical protein